MNRSTDFTIGYQGVPGCYSEQAIHTCLKNKQPKTKSYPHFNLAFEGLIAGEVDRILLPFENSLGGSIHLNYDLLEQYPVFIQAEYNLRISHCLLAPKGTSKDQITTVLSHPQALSQCRHKLTHRKVAVQEHFDTAGAARDLTNFPVGTAALASSLAAEIYNLDVLEESMEDEPGNYTRFLLLGTKPLDTQVSSPKSSIVFSLKNSVGALYQVLSVFSLFGVDLTKIESRPKRHRDSSVLTFDYLFYLEYLGDNEITQRIIHTLGQTIDYHKVLGSYPINSSIYTPVQALTIAIIGFGRFGEFLARKLVVNHQVYATSRSNRSTRCQTLGIDWCDTIEGILQQRPEVIVLCTSISSLTQVATKMVKCLAAEPEYYPLVVDVLSVKQHPTRVLTELLPEGCDLLATHPMFGPDSCPTQDWSGQPFVYSPTRIRNQNCLNRYLQSFQECNLIKMDSETHDKLASKSQFIAHLVGRIMEEMKLTEGPIDTATYRSLLHLKKLIQRDSLELFQGLYKYNSHSHESLTAFQDALSKITEGLRLFTTPPSSS